jgi:hypothetical protein
MLVKNQIFASSMEKDYLILKRASASRPSGEWSADDYDVLADGEVVGRIFKVNAAPRRAAMDVDARIRASRRPHTNARLCRDTRGRHEGIREELAAGLMGCFS